MKWLNVLLCLVLCVNGKLVHMWSFEGTLADRIGSLNGTGLSDYVYSGPCNEYGGGKGRVLTFTSLQVNLVSDFLVSFYFKVSENVTSGYVPLVNLGDCNSPYRIEIGIYDGTVFNITFYFDGNYAFDLSFSDSLLKNFHQISFGKSGGQLLLFYDGFQRSVVNNAFPWVVTNMVLGGAGCSGETARQVYFDEFQVFDEFYDPYDISRDKCITFPPMPVFASLADDHSSFNVTYLSFYAQFADFAYFTININGVNAGSPYATEEGLKSSLNFSIFVYTNWSFTAPLQSLPIFLLPVGQLRHAWSFENSYMDLIGASSPATQNHLPIKFVDGICGQALETSNNTGTRYSLDYSFSDIAYQNDFTISFWMRIEGDIHTNYAILGQRVECQATNSWDLRYYSSQKLAFELFSNYSSQNFLTLNAPVSGSDFFRNWQHIIITRQLYNVSIFINGSMQISEYFYINPNITHPLGLSEDPCIPSDSTLQAPTLQYDEILIFDRFVDPALLSQYLCMQNISTPRISLSGDNTTFDISPLRSFYENYTTISFDVYYKINNGTPTFYPSLFCEYSPCKLPRDYPTENYTFWVVASFPAGNVSSSETLIKGNPLPCQPQDFNSCPQGMRCTNDSICACLPNLVPLPHAGGCIGVCGNTMCDYNENCTSCPEDCCSSPSPSPSPTVSPIPTPSPSPSPTLSPTLSPSPSPSPLSCANHGGCDYRVACSDNGGNITCGKCPLGTLGDGKLCTTVCGDGNCDIIYAENCVTCPTDCKDATCDACGDGVCNANETCATCSEDCFCISTPLKCPQDCDHQGTCAEGRCICVAPWTGPSCSSKNQPISPKFNTSSPTFDITPNSDVVQFSFSMRSLREMDQNQVEIQFVYVRKLNFTLVRNLTEDYLLYNYSTMLENSAVLNVIIRIFNDTTQIEFAGKEMTFTPNTIKVNVLVQNWPFRSLSNSLVATFDSNSNSKPKECLSSFSSDRSLQWITVTIDKVTLYGQFEGQAVVDGRVREVTYTLNQSDNSVAAVLPHFWDFAELDPQFSVLLEDPTSHSCEKAKNTRLIIEIAVPCAVGAILVVVLLLFGFTRLHTYLRIHKGNKEIRLQ